MQLDRGHVVAALREQGSGEAADRAERELGDLVDTRVQADLLRELGLDPDHRAQGGRLAVQGRRSEPAGGTA